MTNDLKEYRKRRRFKETTEPKGRIKKTGLSRFVVQKHQARNLHYDFRLELPSSVKATEGKGWVLKSWAVPKGLPDKKGIKRLAIQTEDHPVDYINFAGEIPAGLYGAGTVKIFDKGNYKLVNRTEDIIEFELWGKKYRGNYTLIKLKTSKYKAKRPSWLIIKK